jgi:hypothetical protein
VCGVFADINTVISPMKYANHALRRVNLPFPSQETLPIYIRPKILPKKKKIHRWAWEKKGFILTTKNLKGAQINVENVSNINKYTIIPKCKL